MYFTRLDSRQTDPRLFVNRKDDVDALVSVLEGHLRAEDIGSSFAARVTGEKGSGKTIFIKHVMEKLRVENPLALFLYVDCRLSGTSRRVFQRTAEEVVSGLGKLIRAGSPLRPELLAAAQVVNTLASFDDVEQKRVHENLTQYKAAAGLSVDAALLSYLKINLGVSLERSEKQIGQLTGTVRIDERRLAAMFAALFADIRREGIRIVVVVDNLDELQHDYRDPSQREIARQQAQWVLELKTSPVAFIACMRSYFADVARDIGNKWQLDRLPANVLLAILEKRMLDEPEDVQQRFASEEVRSLASMFASAAHTPLAYLDWFSFFCREKAFDKPRRQRALERFVMAEQAGLAFDLLEQMGRCFERYDRELDRGELLNACGNRESEVVAAIDTQAVLPNNFWSVTRYRLDPALHLLLPDLRKRIA